MVYKYFSLQVQRVTDWSRQEWLVVTAKLHLNAGIGMNRFIGHCLNIQHLNGISSLV